MAGRESKNTPNAKLQVWGHKKCQVQIEPEMMDQMRRAGAGVVGVMGVVGVILGVFGLLPLWEEVCTVLYVHSRAVAVGIVDDGCFAGGEGDGRFRGAQEAKNSSG